MDTANQCDLRCPYKAYLAAMHRQQMRKTTGLRTIMTVSVRTGLHGVGQMFRALNCRQSQLAPSDWTPDPECQARVRAALSKGVLDTRLLDEYSRGILEPYLKPDPPEEV